MRGGLSQFDDDTNFKIRFGTYSTSEAVIAGLDLEMPGKTRWRGGNLIHAVWSRVVPEHVLDERVRNVLNLINFADKSGIPENGEEKVLDREEDRKLLRKAAADSVVLLKNNGNVLPFDKTKPIAVIGPNSKVASYSGGGSASLAPYYTVTPFEGVVNNSQADVLFSQGVYAHKSLPQFGSSIKTPDGKPGITFKVYNEPPEAENRECVDELHLTQTFGTLTDYENPKVKSFTFYVDMEGIFTPEEDGIYDFGVMVAGTGRLYVDGELVVDNYTTQREGVSFFNTGTLEERGSKELKAGVSYKILFQFGSGPTTKLAKRNVIGENAGGFHFGVAKRLNPEESIARAVELAAKTEQVVVFAGLNGEWESEGSDREHMDLPPGTDELISRVLEANPNAAIVIQSGTPVTMPWADKANVLAQAWFGGNELGNGIADVLYGNVNPSGKLPLSFPVRLEDNPAYINFGSDRGRVLYGEDVYVGYRYYEKKKVKPLFPFGHGLSYTVFERSGLTLESSPEQPTLEDGETITATLTVTNKGSVAGAEVVQLWVRPPLTSSIQRPLRELKGFTKVFLEPGASEKVSIVVEKKLATSYWDEIRQSWASESGEYEVLITGTGNEVLRAPFTVERTRYWRGL